MAAYNTQSYIADALDSVFAQTYPHFEIIVVDDASTDGTYERVASYTDSRLKLLRNEQRCGPAFSRNRAIREACGKYVAILDSDDFWAPEKLQKQVSFLERHSGTVGVGSYIYETDETGRKIKAVRFALYPGPIRCSTFFRCSFAHSSVMMRRSFIVEHDLWYNETFPGAQDYELWIRAVFAGNFHQLPYYLAFYRKNPGQLSTHPSKVQQKNAIRVYRQLLQKLDYEPTDNELSSHLRLVGMKELTEEEKEKSMDVLEWCVDLYKKNLDKMVFRPYLFASEILLRFLKYCRDNSLGFLRSLRLMICLHWRMRCLFFPYFQLFQRLSVNLKDV